MSGELPSPGRDAHGTTSAGAWHTGRLAERFDEVKGWAIACAILAAYTLAMTTTDQQTLALLLAMLALPIPVFMSSRDSRRAGLAVPLPMVIMLFFEGGFRGGPQTALLPLQMCLVMALANALCLPPYRLYTWLIQTAYLALLCWNLDRLNMAVAPEPLLFSPLLFFGAARLARPAPAPLLEDGQAPKPTYMAAKLLSLIWGGGFVMMLLAGTPGYFIAFPVLMMLFLRLTRLFQDGPSTR